MRCGAAPSDKARGIPWLLLLFRENVNFRMMWSFRFPLFWVGFWTINFFFTACHSQPVQPPLFKKIASGTSGIHFNNKITENDSINPIDEEFLYNGGGVGVGDFNKDGLPDLYFTGSQVSNKLYLNKGNFSFSDITLEARVTGEGRWCNGVSVVDINNDGWPDIYVCTTIKKDPAQRTNLLYVNQGPDKNGIPVFREMAAEYGLADTSYSVQAAFFDYDNDGDLDMYLVTTKLTQRDAAIRFASNNASQDHRDVDKLFRNDWNDSLKHPVFTDVSAAANITDHGYGLGVAIVDINRDGWKDIYVSNDFLGSDLLYINNGNGTFTNRIGEYFKHTSQNAMGNAMADINNDGLADLLTVDMDPEDNFRKKKNMGGANYTIYQNMLYGNYMLQYVRNTLQLNQGPRVNGHDSIGPPIFSDISFYAGVAETDWSWNPSLADFDNDGFRDILITNGYPRDVTDHDFSAFRQEKGAAVSKKELISQVPQIRIPDYAFKNKGDLQFENVTKAWGMETPSFSNGAVYVDLDNDGDLDYVVNNINDEAFVYENTLNGSGFLDIIFKGDDKNPDGIGAWAEIYYGNGQLQVFENSPYRGYLSTVEAKAHFGLGRIALIDSAVIKWPNGKQEVLRKVAANQVMTADIRNASTPYGFGLGDRAVKPLFTDITSSAGIQYFHHETDFIDFNKEKLLPHKLSQYGPSLAAGDLDGNGLDDIFIGTSAGEYGQHFLLQQPDGRFLDRTLPAIAGKDTRFPENLGTLIFDADGDGYPDLYCASGSNEFPAGSKDYQDRLWINDGKGNFRLDTSAIPVNYTSKSCVKAADIDHDGDLDLFIGGRVLPGNYPLPVNSFIYRNDSRPGHPKFTDITATVAPGLQQVGMVCDAVWTDFDNDGWTDLILTGEWMPIRFFRNDHGKFVDVTLQSGVAGEIGWWNSITAGDFDNDGDIDYIVGNLGENSFYKASAEHPVSIYAKDFDKNQSLDAIITLFLPDGNGGLKEFPAASRDEMMKQLPGLKKKYLTYKEFGQATFSDIFSKEEIKDAYFRHANNFYSCYLENTGSGHFKMHRLPGMAQLAPIYGMVADDFNQDGMLDLALSGNDFGTEVTTGRYDALNGLVLLGDGKGNFQPRTILQSGLFLPGDGKSLVKLMGPGNTSLLAASQNNGPLKLFSSKGGSPSVRLKPKDRILLITLKNGKIRREEVGYGSSFLSQSSRFTNVNGNIRKIEVINDKGENRVLYKMLK
ncbi:VCBS repeat-containing protein [Flavitalea flava]